MGTLENSREPCPDRIVDNIGSAFSMGAVGGSAFHFIKGVYNSPKYHCLSGGSQAVRMNAPRVGGSFVVWGGLFSVFDCTFVYVKQKEDPWNSIMAGAATGGLLSMRKGLRATSGSALMGGVLFAAIEGAGIMFQKFVSAQQNMPVVIEDLIPNMASGGWGGAGFQVRISLNSRMRRRRGSEVGSVGRRRNRRREEDSRQRLVPWEGGGKEKIKF